VVFIGSGKVSSSINAKLCSQAKPFVAVEVIASPLQELTDFSTPNKNAQALFPLKTIFRCDVLKRITRRTSQKVDQIEQVTQVSC
tara:strand:- start:3660 stop:3914 length:255 start_codon:yes stop_codon:yes gene_type:complete